MRSPFASLIVWPLALLLLYGSLGCQGFNFSDGERSGTVYKISHKGFLNPTWEGRLSLGQMVPDAKGMPTWRKLVDVTRLDLGNGFSCILGEVYGDYETGGTKVFRTRGWERETAAAYGFNTPMPVSGDSYNFMAERRQMRALTSEWKRQIREAA